VLNRSESLLNAPLEKSSAQDKKGHFLKMRFGSKRMGHGHFVDTLTRVFEPSLSAFFKNRSHFFLLHATDAPLETMDGAERRVSFRDGARGC